MCREKLCRQTCRVSQKIRAGLEYSDTVRMCALCSLKNLNPLNIFVSDFQGIVFRLYQCLLTIYTSLAVVKSCMCLLGINEYTYLSHETYPTVPFFFSLPVEPNTNEKKQHSREQISFAKKWSLGKHKTRKTDPIFFYMRPRFHLENWSLLPFQPTYTQEALRRSAVKSELCFSTQAPIPTQNIHYLHFMKR